VVAQAAAADVVVDGLLGIGARGALRGVAAELVSLLAGPGAARHRGRHPERDRRGLGRDPDGPVLAADLTVTFGVATSGLLLPPASGVVGRWRSSTSA